MIALAIMLANLRTVAADAPATQPQTDEQRMESWWEDLEKADPQATRAALNFSTKPEQTVAFFKSRLAPLNISEDDVNKLLADLSSDDEAVWKPAFEKLEYFDPRLAIHIGTLMSNVTEPVSRYRLVALLMDREPDAFEGKTIQLRPVGGEEYNFVIDNASMWAEAKVERLTSGTWENGKRKWARAVRAIVLLEHFGTPDAIAILKDMASGNADAQPTKVAQEALANLGQAGQ
jgi:hypothetical protein